MCRARSVYNRCQAVDSNKLDLVQARAWCVCGAVVNVHALYAHEVYEKWQSVGMSGCRY